VEAVYLTFIFMLAVLLGVELINKVPSTLHTPLMSGSNAISGITLVGALISSTALPEHAMITSVLATSAVFFATINVVGGYVVTDRMLAMFKKTPGGK
jgi:NAD(P) transhydrogenase subunit alpha